MSSARELQLEQYPLAHEIARYPRGSLPVMQRTPPASFPEKISAPRKGLRSPEDLLPAKTLLRCPTSGSTK
jgi:hypothetical protein